VHLGRRHFSLLGGRMTDLDQPPGAHLIYGVRKRHISVFVFQERSLPARLSDSSLGLRYFVIGDANAANIDSLARLFKTTS
jgi:anti-sigma factor RsiW